MKQAALILAVVLVVGLVAAGWLFGDRSNDGALAVEPVTAETSEENDANLATTDVDAPTDAAEPVEREAQETVADGREEILEPSSLAIEVVHKDGTPAFGALVILVSPSAILASGRTDDDGKIDLEADLARAQVVVAGASTRPHREQVPKGESSMRIELDDGAVLSGVVRIDGEPPEEPLELTLRNADRNIVYLPENWRFHVPEASNRSQASQDTGKGGAFHFSAMRANWFGEISFGERYVLADGSDDWFKVDRPRTGLIIELTRKPMLTGRVLDPTDMSEVAEANVQYELRFEFGSTSSLVRTGDDGRFYIPLDIDDSESASLSIFTEDGSGRKLFEVESIDSQFGTDVGDLFLDATRDVAFVAVEIDGRPIANAIATIGDEDNRISSEPTDEHGHGVMKGLLPEVRSMEVFSAVHAETTVTLPPVIDEALRVVLDPCAILEIVVRTKGGDPIEDCVVKLSADGPIFAGDVPEAVRMERSELGASSNRGSSKSHFSGRILKASSEYRTDEEGRVLLPGIHPEAEIAFVVSDAVGCIVGEQYGLVVRKGERRVVELESEHVKRTFTGVLKTADGAVVPDEDVRVQSSTRLAQDESMRERIRAETDEEGVFVVEDIFADRLDLRVDHADHAVLILEDVVVPDDGSVVEVWLEKPEAVKLFVVDANGEPHVGGAVSVYSQDERIGRPRSSGGGIYELTNLPRVPLRLEYKVSGRVFEREFDARDETVRIELPAASNVDVSWALAELPETYHVIALEPEGEGDVISKWFPPEKATLEGSHTFATVFPGTYRVTMSRRHEVDGEHIEIASPQTVVVGEKDAAEVLLTP